LANIEKDKVIVYTDGSCEPNPGLGGWAAIILDEGRETILKGFSKDSTNNRMELMAAIKALKHIPAQKDVLIYTDSQYLKNGVESWMKDWKARNWKRKGGKLKNVDLWKQISDEIDQRRIYWRWVKGHNNNPYNERADRLARKMMKKRK
jgi:ribonuclease HI